MKELKLEKCTNVFCEFLSTGERRRTTMGLELVVRLGVATLDEPTSALDR